MNWIDYTIFTTLFFAALFGLASGPIIQMLRVVGLFISFFLAVIFCETLGKILQGTFPTLTAYLVSYFIIYFVSCIVAYIIVNIIRRLLGEMSIGLGLRLLGGIFGVLKGLVFCGAIIVGILLFSSKNIQTVTNSSKTASQIGDGMQAIASIVPRDVLSKMNDSEEETREIQSPKEGKARKSATKKDKKPVKSDKARDEIIEESEEDIVPPQE